ncbi:MAG: hypothetical protein EBR54_07375 [Flavobacteriia bacterium]|nr:hypothetical protein [Flavobacteriia bacterium]NBX39214.1 hypothetical protein [Flavobacteriia bacterium]
MKKIVLSIALMAFSGGMVAKVYAAQTGVKTELRDDDKKKKKKKKSCCSANGEKKCCSGGTNKQ